MHVLSYEFMPEASDGETNKVWTQLFKLLTNYLVLSDRKYVESKSEHKYNNFKRKHLLPLIQFLLSAL